MSEVITRDAVELAVAKRLRELAGDTGKVEVTIVHRDQGDAFYSATYSVESDCTKYASPESIKQSEYAYMSGWRVEDMLAYMLEQGFEINSIGHRRHTHRPSWYNNNKTSVNTCLDIFWTRDV